MADITDETFEAEVIERSKTVPVVVDLWAEWCGPCKTLGPILEKVIGETQGLVELAKIDVDANPSVSQAFQVQSIPAVYAMVNGTVVDGFMGAKPEADVVEFVQGLLNIAANGVPEVATEEGEEAAPAEGGAAAPQAAAASPLTAAAPSAPPAAAIVPDAVISAPPGEAVPEPVVAPSAAEAEALVAELEDLLTKVKGDDEARERYIALLDQLGTADPRTNDYRRKLASALF